ncbi:ABC transporter permease [Alsobacter metallidurans]|uniref:ABC transporter permease n=1 Tax=Alsobacter metallidurans TaxID=340221 RepID=A0A917MJH0_9HYPH|nr:DMT family transporter [Alsobacter metallidurans]GGH31080.1 ABC transporter permease [Alsobacter metallidurans]
MIAAQPSNGVVIARLLICSLLWASGFLFMKLAGTVHPFVTAASRASVAAVALAAWFLLRGQNPLPRRDEAAPWLLLGTLNGWLPNVLTAYALSQITAGLSAMIQASGPLMVAVLAHFAFVDERLTGRRVLGVAVGFVGMAVLVGPAAFLDVSGGALGVLAMVAVSFSYAVGNIYAKTVRHVEPARMALGQQSISALASVTLTLLFVRAEAPGQIAANLPVLAALGLVATAVPITIFMTLIRTAGPTKAAMIGYLLPVWATLMAVVVLGETVSPRDVAGAAIILLGVWIVSTAPKAEVG